MSTCFGYEIQTVYSCLNQTEITENRHQKLKPNRGSPIDNVLLFFVKTTSTSPLYRKTLSMYAC